MSDEGTCDVLLRTFSADWPPLDARATPSDCHAKDVRGLAEEPGDIARAIVSRDALDLDAAGSEPASARIRKPVVDCFLSSGRTST
jgi:hypothetical protein